MGYNTAGMDILTDLNPQQKQAVTAGSGQTLVLAGPGSGKTRVLTRRIAYLVGQMQIPPFHILAVTFTNKAAREMENRVTSLVDVDLQGIWLGTFHAMCCRLLRREADYLPVKSNFAIMDADDQENIVKRAMRELNIDEKVIRPAALHTIISNAKNNLILPQQFTARGYREEVAGRVYQRYQELLLSSNALDFDDLLLQAYVLLRDNPEIRLRYARRFEHVLVDEFQDTNLVQYELVKLLSSHHHNIFVVGDEDQSIYRWRGADYRNVLRFEQDFPKCSKVLLEQNYRSTQTVLEVARSVIDRNSNRTPKHLFSERGSGDKVTLYEAVDDIGEAAYVVDTIQQLTMAKKARASDFAVMYRTNAQSRLLEEAFLRAGVPYRLVGAQRFYGRREIKDIIAYLRLVSNPDDEISLGRIISVPPRGIGDKTLIGLQLAARQANVTPGSVLLDLGEKGDQSSFWAEFKGRGAALLADFGAQLAAWRKLGQEHPLPVLFDSVLQESGYRGYIDDGSDEGADRWENVQELRRLAFEYSDRGMEAFLENLALVSDQDTLPEQVDAPTLLTLHAAKGLEFHQVFIIGLDEGLLPHSRSKDDPEEMAEERRLLYVGVTRAKDHLFLVRADRRSSYGGYDESIASQFLEDIPSQFLAGASGMRRSSSSGSFRREENSSWILPPPPGTVRKAAPLAAEAQFKSGQRVRHPVWGEGLVVSVHLQDGEEILDVAFASVGLKRLMASLAKLESISG